MDISTETVSKKAEKPLRELQSAKLHLPSTAERARRVLARSIHWGGGGGTLKNIAKLVTVCLVYGRDGCQMTQGEQEETGSIKRPGVHILYKT